MLPRQNIDNSMPVSEVSPNTKEVSSAPIYNLLIISEVNKKPNITRAEPVYYPMELITQPKLPKLDIKTSIGSSNNSFQKIPSIATGIDKQTSLNSLKHFTDSIANLINEEANINDKQTKTDNTLLSSRQSFNIIHSTETDNTAKNIQTTKTTENLDSPRQTSENPNDLSKVVVKSASKKCTCKKSFCLRLYCDCFSKGLVCGVDCSCKDCHNSNNFKEIREVMVKETIEKNPLAFSSKYKKLNDDPRILHSRGCNCTKTGCVKKYCECFNAATGCSRLCRCVNCKNDNIEIKDSEIKVYYEKVLRKRRKHSAFVQYLDSKFELNNKE
jgi:hypothetical protein